MALYKIWASRVNNAEAAEFDGDLGQIWYDETTGNLRLYTGAPGGQIINGSGGGGNAALPLSNGTSNFNIATANGNATITVNGFSDTAVFGVNSLAIGGVFSTPKTINSNVQVAEAVNAVAISPLTVGELGNIFVPDDSTFTIFTPT